MSVEMYVVSPEVVNTVNAALGPKRLTVNWAKAEAYGVGVITGVESTPQKQEPDPRQLEFRWD